MKWDNLFNGIEYYSNVKSSSVEWIWYPYIPCGKITVLQGDPGEGKSTLILHIAAILTKGANLPDGNKIKKPMTVIYQCSEDSKSDRETDERRESGEKGKILVYDVEREYFA